MQQSDHCVTCVRGRNRPSNPHTPVDAASSRGTAPPAGPHSSGAFYNCGMSINVDPLLLKILQDCAAAEPAPLYPKDFAEKERLDRGRLDAALDHLRLTGLVVLTDWVPGQGQGYALTDDGREILHSPWLLEKRREIVPAPVQRSHGEDLDLRGTPWQRGEEILESLRNPKPPRVTRFLLIANIAIFVLGAVWVAQRGGSVGTYLSGEMLDPQVNQVRDEMGTLLAGKVLNQGQWWRLLTYAFLHGGFFHILLNMYFLFNVGPTLESIWGSARYLVLYLVSALGGGVVVVLLGQNALGASGALCGLLTSLAFWIWLNRNHLPRELVSRWLGNSLMNIVLIALISLVPGVSWAGHLGGAVAGLVVTVPLNLHRYGTAGRKTFGLLGTILVPVLLVVPIVRLLSTPTEDEFLRYRIAPALHEVESRLIPAYNRFAGPILKGDLQQLVDDPPRLEEAKKDFTLILEDLGALENRLQAVPFQEEEAKRTAQLVDRYVRAWKAFFDQCLRAVLDPAGFGRDQRNALRRQSLQVWEEQRPLRNHALVHSVIAEKE